MPQKANGCLIRLAPKFLLSKLQWVPITERSWVLFRQFHEIVQCLHADICTRRSRSSRFWLRISTHRFVCSCSCIELNLQEIRQNTVCFQALDEILAGATLLRPPRAAVDHAWPSSNWPTQAQHHSFRLHGGGQCAPTPKSGHLAFAHLLFALCECGSRKPGRQAKVQMIAWSREQDRSMISALQTYLLGLKPEWLEPKW